MQNIYLDYNATTPIAPSVQEAMLPFLAEQFGNPSSSHAPGRSSREAVEDARSRVASLLAAERDEIIFTSGGTESNNLALKGVLLKKHPRGGGHLIISSVEHPAITKPARYLESLGIDLSVIGCDSQGRVNPAEIEAAVRPDTVLVSIMHANNEIGTIEPIREIADFCHARGVLMHTDAAQSVAKIPVRVRELGIDLLSVAGHKMYGPKGIGALYVRRGTPIDPILHGAGHEAGLRSGTENVPFIVALGTAATLAEQNLTEATEHMGKLRDRLRTRLHDAIGERLTVNGEQADRLPNTLSVNFPDVIGSELLEAIPELFASTGAACHSDSIALSPTMAAIGLDKQVARGTLRLSLGHDTSEDQIDLAARALVSAWRKLVSSK